MKNYGSNHEFFADLKKLIEGWCDERRLDALARLLPGYLAVNGLTDGWVELANALKSVRGLGYESFSEHDWNLLNDLIHAADQATRYR